MSAEDLPQIYLVTPEVFDIDSFPDQLANILDSVEIACLRLSLTTLDENLIAKSADALRQVAHARDVALVIERHSLHVDR